MTPTDLALTITAALAFGYAASLLAHPFTRCRTCHATGSITGQTDSTGRSCCRKCSGTGHRPRSGIRHLTAHLTGPLAHRLTTAATRRRHHRADRHTHRRDHR